MGSNFPNLEGAGRADIVPGNAVETGDSDDRSVGKPVRHSRYP